jgi:hypothetical protein
LPSYKYISFICGASTAYLLASMPSLRRLLTCTVALSIGGAQGFLNRPLHIDRRGLLDTADNVLSPIVSPDVAGVTGSVADAAPVFKKKDTAEAQPAAKPAEKPVAASIPSAGEKQDAAPAIKQDAVPITSSNKQDTPTDIATKPEPSTVATKAEPDTKPASTPVQAKASQESNTLARSQVSSPTIAASVPTGSSRKSSSHKSLQPTSKASVPSSASLSMPSSLSSSSEEIKSTGKNTDAPTPVVQYVYVTSSTDPRVIQTLTIVRLGTVTGTSIADASAQLNALSQANSSTGLSASNKRVIIGVVVGVGGFVALAALGALLYRVVGKKYMSVPHEAESQHKMSQRSFSTYTSASGVSDEELATGPLGTRAQAKAGISSNF